MRVQIGGGLQLLGLTQHLESIMETMEPLYVTLWVLAHTLMCGILHVI